MASFSSKGPTRREERSRREPEAVRVGFDRGVLGEVEFAAGTDKPRALSRPVLFETAITLPQLRLFGLDPLGNDGWLKALRLEDYAPRRLRPESLQQALFPYHEAWG